MKRSHVNDFHLIYQKHVVQSIYDVPIMYLFLIFIIQHFRYYIQIDDEKENLILHG